MSADRLFLTYAPPPGAAGATLPPWIQALVTEGDRLVRAAEPEVGGPAPAAPVDPVPPAAGDISDPLPETTGAVLLCNPVFGPELIALVRAARARGVPVTGLWESSDFDLSLWGDGPLRGHPLAGQDDMLIHIRTLARALALCDRALITGPGMGGRLARRLPGLVQQPLPFAAPGPLRRPPAKAGPPCAAFLASTPALRTALLPHLDLLLAALASADAELRVCADTILPPEAKDHPRIHRLPAAPGPAGAMAFYRGADLALFPPIGGGYWQREQQADPVLAALCAGVACWGTLPEQLLVDPPRGARLSSAPPDWTELPPESLGASLASAMAPLPRLTLLDHLQRWRWQRRHDPRRVARALRAMVLGPVLAEIPGHAQESR